MRLRLLEMTCLEGYWKKHATFLQDELRFLKEVNHRRSATDSRQSESKRPKMTVQIIVFLIFKKQEGDFINSLNIFNCSTQERQRFHSFCFEDGDFYITKLNQQLSLLIEFTEKHK